MSMPLAPHFSDGYDSGRSPELSPGLQAQSDKWSAESMQAGTRPTSVLQQIGLSPMSLNVSATDASNRYNPFTGSTLPGMGNGASENTAQTALRLRFAGDAGEM
jgi:hypothetical protein